MVAMSVPWPIWLIVALPGITLVLSGLGFAIKDRRPLWALGIFATCWVGLGWVVAIAYLLVRRRHPAVPAAD